jgi:hypothetical protein
LSAFRTRELQDDWTIARLDDDLKPQEPTALPLRVDHGGDRTEHVIGRWKFETKAVLGSRVLGPERDNARQQFGRACVQLSWLQRASDRFIRRLLVDQPPLPEDDLDTRIRRA